MPVGEEVKNKCHEKIRPIGGKPGEGLPLTESGGDRNKNKSLPAG